MSFGTSSSLPSVGSLNVFNPPPVSPPPGVTAASGQTGAGSLPTGPTPAAPPAFGLTPGAKPQAQPSQPTFLGAALTPTQGSAETRSPSLIGQGAQVSPSQVAAVGAGMGRGRR